MTAFAMQRWCFVITTLIVAMSAAIVQAEESLVPQPFKPEGKLVCIGDSITAGEGVNSSACYVGLLQAEAKAEHLNLEVVGQGRSGWSTGSYVDNKDKVVKALPTDATIVSIFLGTNDSRESGSPKEVSKKAAENLAKLIDMYKEKVPNARFVIVAPTKQFARILTKRLLNAHYGEASEENLKEISVSFEALAKQRGLLYIDLGGLPSLPEKSIDGIHPNAAGHQEIYRAFWKGLFAAAPSTRPQSN